MDKKSSVSENREELSTTLEKESRSKVLNFKEKTEIKQVEEVVTDTECANDEFSEGDADSDSCSGSSAEGVTDSEGANSTFSEADSDSDDAEGVYFMFLTEPSVTPSESESVGPLTKPSVVH